MRWRQRGRRSTRGMLGEREWSGGGARESRGWALEWLRVAAAKTEGRFELSAITLVGGQGSWLNREDLKNSDCAGRAKRGGRRGAGSHSGWVEGGGGWQVLLVHEARWERQQGGVVGAVVRVGMPAGSEGDQGVGAGVAASRCCKN